MTITMIKKGISIPKANFRFLVITLCEIYRATSLDKLKIAKKMIT